LELHSTKVDKGNEMGEEESVSLVEQSIYSMGPINIKGVQKSPSSKRPSTSKRNQMELK